MHDDGNVGQNVQDLKIRRTEREMIFSVSFIPIFASNLCAFGS